jgi:NADPH-dependent 2,4-dienoyl-CoA reductase/sulfur reductase-like enzyme
MINRRYFLAASAALAASSITTRALGKSPADLLPESNRQRVLIVGGGWGGLTAARQLRTLAPELDVVLVDRQPSFTSLPLSNKWLTGVGAATLIRQDYSVAARAFGYQVLCAEVNAIDRDTRQLYMAQGRLRYDWLILAAGIRHDYGAWFGDDIRSADEARRQFPAGFMSDELEALKRTVDRFKGGNLLMTVPPPPARCPPAPYERAVMIAWMMKKRGIRGRLILVDPGAGMQRFNRMFSERYKDQIQHLTHAPVRVIDPFKKRLSTEFDEISFEEAILIPPQQAADLVWQAGLIGREVDGKPTGWANADPLHLQAPDDKRIFLIGDLLGKVSPLFGYYPKSAHMASQLGRIAAGEIVARVQEKPSGQPLPESICHVYSDVEPMEMLRVENRYRLRGDGLIVQTVRQFDEPQPRGEDAVWAKSLHTEMLGEPPQ